MMSSSVTMYWSDNSERTESESMSKGTAEKSQFMELRNSPVRLRVLEQAHDTRVDELVTPVVHASHAALMEVSLKARVCQCRGHDNRVAHSVRQGCRRRASEIR